MYLIEYINEDRDVVLRRSYPNVKMLLWFFVESLSTINSLNLNMDATVTYSVASINGYTIGKLNKDETYPVIYKDSVLEIQELYDALPPHLTFAKLLLNPVQDKLEAYLKASKVTEIKIPYIASIKGRMHSFKMAESLWLEDFPHFKYSLEQPQVILANPTYDLNKYDYVAFELLKYLEVNAMVLSLKPHDLNSTFFIEERS